VIFVRTQEEKKIEKEIFSLENFDKKNPLFGCNEEELNFAIFLPFLVSFVVFFSSCVWKEEKKNV